MHWISNGGLRVPTASLYSSSSNDLKVGFFPRLKSQSHHNNMKINNKLGGQHTFSHSYAIQCELYGRHKFML